MNHFSKIDMGEVTRLTRAGKLAEAMALLQGQTAAANEESSREPHRTKAMSPTIEMQAPTVQGGAWTAPLARKMATFRDPLSELGLSGPRKGSGSFRRSVVRVPEGARFEERAFSNDLGSRTYKVYVPSRYSGEALPVVVMLHGCTQDPDDFAAGTRMNELAEEKSFLVAYPRQSQSANPQRCWNWFNTEDQRRNGAEPSLIAGIALQVIEEFHAEPTRVYVAGLSAGGAAAAIMGATYPDLFAAVGVHSGLACGAASDMPSAFTAMAGNATIAPGGRGRTVPTIVFHGDADRTVNPVNSDHIVAQARRQGPLTKVVARGEAPGGMSYSRTVHSDAAGAEVVEQWLLHGAGHAWSGGSASGSYTDPRGPDASREMIRFFLRHAKATA